MQPLHCSGGKYYPNNVILLWIYFITCHNGSAYIPEATKLVSVPACFVNGYSKSPTFNIASGDKPCCKKLYHNFTDADWACLVLYISCKLALESAFLLAFLLDFLGELCLFVLSRVLVQTEKRYGYFQSLGIKAQYGTMQKYPFMDQH